jgi:uncharacterized protein YaiI (UPF0178 family)
MNHSSAVQWKPKEIDARVAALMDDLGGYPFDDSAKDARVRTTVTLSKQDHEDIEFFVNLWREIDKVTKRKGKKWKASTVMARFIERELEAHWAKLGGRPSDPDQLEKLKREALKSARDRVSKK